MASPCACFNEKHVELFGSFLAFLDGNLSMAAFEKYFGSCVDSCMSKGLPFFMQIRLVSNKKQYHIITTLGTNIIYPFIRIQKARSV